MTDATTNKRREKFEEERASDQFAWDSIREGSDLGAVDARTLIHLGRKRAKRDLYDWANRVADKFWDVHRRHKNGEDVPREFGGYGVRIIEQGWTVTIQWYFTKGRGGKLKPTMEVIKGPEGKTYRMPPSRFAQAKDWELEAISRAEDEFEVIRRCSEHLKSMTPPFLGYVQVLDEHERKRKA